MIKPVKHFSTNWVEGMKISKEHFDAQDDFFLDTVRDSNSLFLNNYNFGLLPVGDENLPEIQNTATGDAELFILICQAITPYGNRINIENYKVSIDKLLKEVGHSKKQEEEVFYILISIDPFTKIAYGEINMNETPPRQPYTLPKHHVYLVNEDVFYSSGKNNDFVTIGKVFLQPEGGIRIDSGFIPPCTLLKSHKSLMRYHQQFIKVSNQLQTYAINIIQKASHKNENTSLAINIKNLCKSYLNNFSKVNFKLQNHIVELPPVNFIEIYSSLALDLFYSINMLIPSQKEEMLNYCLEWSEIGSGTLLSQLKSVSEIKYDHNNIAEHLQIIDILLNSLERIFNQLNQLDYIGQKKENIIVNEKTIKVNKNPDQGWSVVD